MPLLPRAETPARVQNGQASLRQDGALSVALLNSRIGLLGEKIDLAADEGGADRQYRQHDHDLRHEGQGHFLNLRQRLEERDEDADHHGGPDRGAGHDEDRPHRRAHQLKGIGFVHRYSIDTPVGRLKVEPLLKGAVVAALEPVVRLTVLPLLNVAVTPPFEFNVTEAI